MVSQVPHDRADRRSRGGRLVEHADGHRGNGVAMAVDALVAVRVVVAGRRRSLGIDRGPLETPRLFRPDDAAEVGCEAVRSISLPVGDVVDVEGGLSHHRGLDGRDRLQCPIDVPEVPIHPRDRHTDLEWPVVLQLLRVITESVGQILVGCRRQNGSELPTEHRRSRSCECSRGETCYQKART